MSKIVKVIFFLLMVGVIDASPIKFAGQRFLEVEPTFLGDRAKTSPEGILFQVDVQFTDKALIIIGKESRYSAIKTIPYTTIKSLIYEETSKKSAKAAVAALMINPLIILATPDEEQHWFKVTYENGETEKEALFLLEHDAQMKIKYLAQKKTGIVVVHRANGSVPHNHLKPGMSIYDVLAKIGDPLRSIYFGNKTIFFYETHILGMETKMIFQDGKLVELY